MIKQLELHSKQFEVWEDPHRFKVVCAGRRWGKALYINTPILTAQGFKKMADIQEGDYVFDERGKPCKVAAKSPIFYGRVCYKITFSDGAEIIADANHEWLVETKRYRKNISRNKNTLVKKEKLTTEQIHQNYALKRSDGRIEHNYSISLVPVDFPKRKLSLDPYFLGLWLGDGNSYNSKIAANDIEAEKFLEKSAFRYKRKLKIFFNTRSNAKIMGIAGDKTQESRSNSVQAKLRLLNLLGNKHIPKEYLFSSCKQRIELLRGLMDSDGYCRNGFYEYSTINKRLAKDIKILLSTLGIKAVLHRYKTYLYGKLCKDRFRFHFSANLDLFKIKRKKDKQKTKRKKDIFRRFIINVKQISSVPVQCLTADSPSGLFLAGEDLIITHNSTLAIVSCLTACQKKNAITAIVAPTYQQAKDIYWRDPEKIPSLIPPEAVVKKNDSELFIQLVNGSYLYLRGSDRIDTLRGLRYDFAVLDEYASMKENVWEQIIQPTLIDSGGSALFISSPKGFEKFHSLWLKGQWQDPNWKSWKFTSYDNPYLDRQFIEQCKKDMNEDTFGQEILAEFKKFTGLVYKDFDRDKHVIEPIELKDGWTYYRAVDFGFVNPTAVLFAAISDKGIIYVFDEIYQTGLQTPDLANLIKQKSIGRNFTNTIADSAQIADIEELRKYGLAISPVEKKSGTQEDWTTFRIRKAAEKLRNGQLFVFKNCQNLIYEFENCRYHEVREGQQVKEVPMKINDHLLDALSYLLVSLPEYIKTEYQKWQQYAVPEPVKDETIGF